MLRLIAVCLVVVGVQCLPTPTYIKPCSRSAPDANECVKKAINDAWPTISNGDKKYGVLNLKPIVLPLVEIKSSGLTVQFVDIAVHGLGGLVVNEVEFDFDKNHFQGKVSIPEMEYKGKYKVNGQILVLPIQGEGNADIKFTGGEYVLSFQMERFKKDGVEYGKIINPKVTYTIKKAEFTLDNLFNGDKALGDNMNKFLNENWEDVNKELHEAISKPMAEVCMSVANSYFGNVPFDELVLP